MLSKWPIRDKLLFGIALLLAIVAAQSITGFRGVYSYRGLARSLRDRAEELPLAGALANQVSDLRVILGEVRTARILAGGGESSGFDPADVAARFDKGLDAVGDTLQLYRDQLNGNDPDDTRINDSSGEWATVHKIDGALEQIALAARDEKWLTNDKRLEVLHVELERLQSLAWHLPSFLHKRIHNFAGEVRSQYRAMILLNWVTTVMAAVLLALIFRLFYAWVFRPLGVLVQGSRKVAGGEFGYRIKLQTHDEMAELAEAMNAMTARFEAIRDDLDRQVRQRTKQVVRSEQLASVGFLAAGVAHEINNPLASIALCGESLESRLQEVLEAAPDVSDEDRRVILSYMQMIQSEAFRCKGITERLLDFSRMGDVTRQSTDLAELVQGVIDMVGHLGRYGDKRIEFAPRDPVIAPVNPQELKQVVLNLLTNALDSLDSGGHLKVELSQTPDAAELVFTDNGCGMTEEVQKHLFEPFFTRKRNGQGTGLGLSITYRIVADHGGSIDVHSDGPGKGSRFCVQLPLAQKHKEHDHRHQAA